MGDNAHEEFLDADGAPTKSDGLESFDVASQKYKIDVRTPIKVDCEVCGESISNTQEWLLHHFTDWHRRVVKWADLFRTKCIDQQDEDATTSFADAVNCIKDSVLYTQELFEVDSRLFCCACACEVVDIAEHLSSAGHNESVLNVVDSSAFIKIKEKCLDIDSSGVNEDLYRNEILTWLAEELPPTADSPLEVVVLKKDNDFFSWFEGYRCALNNVVDARRTSTATHEEVDIPLLSLSPSCNDISYESTLSAEVVVVEASESETAKHPEGMEVDFEPSGDTAPAAPSESIASEEIAEKCAIPASESGEKLEDKAETTTSPTILPTTPILEKVAEPPPSAGQGACSPAAAAADANSCAVCDVKCFSRATFLNHTMTSDHAKKTKIHDFLNSEGKFIIGAEPATAQAQFDATADDVVGLNEIYEMYHASTRSRFWICGVCYCGVVCSDNFTGHLQGVKHKKRYIECRYPEKKKRISNKNEMEQWLNQVLKDITALEGKGKLKHAMVVADDIADVLKSVGVNGSTKDVPVPVDKAKKQENSASSASISGKTKPDVIQNEANANTAGQVVSGGSETNQQRQSQPKQDPPPAIAPVAVETTNGKPADEPSPSADKKVVRGGGSSKSQIVEHEKPHKEIRVGDSNLVVQCETCWEVVFTNEKDSASKWRQHVLSSDHRKKQEVRKQWKFDPDLFTNSAPSPPVIRALEQAAKSSEVVVVGLNDIVEIRKASSDGKSRDIDVVCLTCAVSVTTSRALASHLASRTHKVKYLKKYYPVEVAMVFKGLRSATFQEISRFLVDKGARAGVVRVYESSSKKVKSKDDTSTKNLVDHAPKPSSASSTTKEPSKVPSKGPLTKSPHASGSSDQKAMDAKKVTTAPKGSGPTDDDVIILDDWKQFTPATSTADAKGTPGESKKASTIRTPAANTTLMDSVVTKITSGEISGSAMAVVTDKRKWIYMAPIYETLSEAELSKLLLTVVPEKVKNLVIRKRADGRRYAIMNAGEGASVLVKKLNGSTLPGFTETLAVEYAHDQKKADDSTMEDVAIKLLMGSPSATIPIRYHAFAQPILDECKDALVGVDEIYEFCSRDLTYEPAYLCKLCRWRCNCSDLIPHLMSVDHRLKYFEKKHPAVYHSLTSGTSPTQKSVLQSLAIKQHAQAIELQEGRARISQRLNIQVDPGPYGMKKNAIAAAAQAKTSSVVQFSSTINSSAYVTTPLSSAGFFSRPPRLVTTSAMLQSKVGSSVDDLQPPGVSLNESATTSTLLDRVTAPYLNAPLPPGVTLEDHLALPSVKKLNPPQQTTWNAQCDRFLAKLSGEGQKKASSGTKESPKAVASSTKKAEDAKKDKRSQEESKKTAKRGRERSADRSSDRRRRSSTSRSRSRRRTRSRSRSRSRSRHHSREERETSKSKSGRRSSPLPSKSSDKKSRTKSKSPKRQSKSPVKSKKDTVSKRRSRSPAVGKKKARLEPKSEKESPSKSGAKSMELPDLLIRLTEQLVKTAPVDKKPELPKRAKPPTADASLLETLLSQMFSERATSSASTSTASEGAVGQLLTMLEKGKSESPKAARTQGASSAGGVEVIMKMLAEEEQRQRRQQEQKNAIMALLSSKLAAGSSGTAGAAAGGTMVIDYGHGSKRSMAQPGDKQPMAPSMSNRASGQQLLGGRGADASDDLVNEAMRNVLRAQGVAVSQPGPAVRAPSAVSAAGPRAPCFPLDMSRPPPPRPPFGGFRPPGPAMFPAQPGAPNPNPQAAAIVNAAAAMLLTSLFNQSMPPHG